VFKLSKKEAAQRVFIIIRDIDNINHLATSSHDKSLIKRFIDIRANSSVDDQDQLMLENLKSRLVAFLPAQNIIRLKTKWCSDKAGVSFKSDPDYFFQFGKAFKDKTIELFNIFYSVSTNITSNYFSKADMNLGEELILQYKLRNSFAESFKNREKLLKEILKYVKSTDRQAFVVHGNIIF